jgi:RNA 3'-terminal phosphate cyclase-like protein
LEVLAALAPFGKDLLKATLKGVTNHSDNLDSSVDTFQHVTIPNLKHFGVDEGVQFKVVKRGAAPNGGGVVVFTCPIVKVLSPIQLVDDGKIKRVRGVAYSVKASSSFSNRVIEAAREVLNPIASDVYIYADISHEKQAKDTNSKQISPGYGLTLVAETTTGCFLSYEHMAQTAEIAEDVGTETTNLFLLETIRRGCVDSSNQSLMLLLMAAGPEDVSKIRLGKLTDYTIEFLRHIQQFFGVTFKIEPEPETKTVLLTCLGAGFKNLSRKTF